MKKTNLSVIRMILLLSSLVGVISNTLAQCPSFENFPEGEKQGQQTHLVYQYFIKDKQYKKVLPHWEQLIKYASGKSTTYYEEGIEMMKSFIEETEDTLKKVVLIERIAQLYEQQITCFCKTKEEEGNLRSLKAYDMYVLEYNNQQYTLEEFGKAFNLIGNSVDAYMVLSYADHATYMFGHNKVEKSFMEILYQRLMIIIDENIGHEDFKETRDAVNEYFKPYEEYIFGCNYWKKKLKKTYDADADNPKVFRPILRKLLQKGCSKEDEFIKELMKKDREYVVHVDYRPIPTAQKGTNAYVKGNYQKAIELYKQAIDETDDADRKAAIQYKIGQIYYAKFKDHANARDFALKAAQNRPKWGKPYMLIGNMYASSGLVCGTGKKDWNSQIIVWAAIDMWEKAKSIEPSVADKANHQIRKYTKYMPTEEQAKKYNIKEGQTVRIECWIQTSTRARFTNKF